MERSAAVQPLPANLSKGYHYKGGSYDARAFEWVSNAPSAPVHATATDMAAFMLAHLETGKYDGGRITRLWVLSVSGTLSVVPLAVLAWKDRYWGVVGRVHYTLVALAAVLFILLLVHWNLIGFHL